MCRGAASTFLVLEASEVGVRGFDFTAFGLVGVLLPVKESKKKPFSTINLGVQSLPMSPSTFELLKWCRKEKKKNN